MKQQHTLKYFISIVLIVVFCNSISAQNNNATEKTTVTNDSIEKTLKYGLRVGIDLSKLLRSSLDDDYKGFEIIGDYRLTKNWYLAGEFGTEENTTATDNLNFSTSGSYFKIGADYNFFDNWLGMENMIYSGFRAGVSTFGHTINSFNTYSTNQYWPIQFTDTTAKEFNGLSFTWIEFLVGIKAEVFNNFFIGINAQLKSRITQDIPDDFENLYVPGFNRTYDNVRIGVGYGYSLSYMIPLYKKNIKKKTEDEDISK